MTHPIICPHCGQTDQVDKVSAIYVRGSEIRWHSKAGDPQNAETQGEHTAPITRSSLLKEMNSTELQKLSRKLSPPATPKTVPTRSIHPDLIVFTFSLVAPVFLYGILNTQPGGLWIVLPVLAGFYAFYFWKRKELIAKFQAQQQAQRSSEARVQRGIQRWMKLYYCARDDGVFEPGGAHLTPVDQIAGHLFKE
jgi:hypothetical protein